MLPPRLAQAIRLAGSRVLHAVARPVVLPGDAAELGPLLKKMQQTLQATKGRGLAAPQVGASLRVFLIASEQPSSVSRLPLVVLNPHIKRSARVRTLEWETCLSVPKYAALVQRPRSVDVEYQTLQGTRVRRKLTGDTARVFQHEFDHLDGILYTERMWAPSFVHERTLRSRVRCAELVELHRRHEAEEVEAVD